MSQVNEHNAAPARAHRDGPAAFDRRSMLKLIGAVAAVGATGGAAACSTALPTTQLEVPTGRTVNIGLVAPALGPFAKIGDDIQKGFKLFLSDHENLLGLNKVNLRMAEEGPSPESAAAAVEGVLKDGIIALAGVASGAGLAAVAPAMVQGQVPLLTCGNAPTSLTPLTYLWRTGAVEGEAGTALAPFAREEGPNAFLLYDDAPYAREEANAFIDEFRKRGGKIVGTVMGKPTWATQLALAKAANASVIFAVHSGADAVALLDAYRTSGLSIKLIGPGSLTETADLSKMAALPNNVYTAMYYAADLDNEVNRRFVSSYFKTHGRQPSGYAMAAYDTASVLNKALRLVKGDPTGPELNKALTLLGQIESPRGVWTFNTNRGPQQRWYLRRLRLDGMVAANLLDKDLQVLS